MSLPNDKSLLINGRKDFIYFNLSFNLIIKYYWKISYDGTLLHQNNYKKKNIFYQIVKLPKTVTNKIITNQINVKIFQFYKESKRIVVIKSKRIFHLHLITQK